MKNKLPHTTILILVFSCIFTITHATSLYGNTSLQNITVLYNSPLPPYFYQSTKNELGGIIPTLLRDAFKKDTFLSFIKIPANNAENFLLKNSNAFYIGIEPLLSSTSKETPTSLTKGAPLLNIEYTIFHDKVLTLQNFTSLASFRAIPIGYTEESGIPLDIFVNYYPELTLQIYPSIKEMIEAMNAGIIKAYILNRNIARVFTDISDLTEYKTPLFTIPIKPYFAKNNTQLIEEVNSAITNVTAITQNKPIETQASFYLIFMGISFVFSILMLYILWRKRNSFFTTKKNVYEEFSKKYFLLQIEKNGDILSISDEVETILGYASEKLVGKNISLFSKDNIQFVSLFQEIQKTKKTKKIRFSTKDETICFLDVYPMHTKDNNVLVFMLIQNDETHTFFANMLNKAPVSIAQINTKGQYLYINETFISEFSKNKNTISRNIFSDFDVTTINTILSYAEKETPSNPHILSISTKEAKQKKTYSLFLYSASIENEKLLDIFLFDISSFTKNNVTNSFSYNISSLINFFPDPTFILDNEGKVLAWNTALEKLTKIPAEEIVGKENSEYSIPFYGTKRPMACDYFLSNNHPGNSKEKDSISVEAFCPYLDNNKGKYLLCSASRIYLSESNFVGIIQTMQDITKRKEELIELERSKRRYSMVLSASNEGMWEWSHKDNSLYLSPKSNEILSIPESKQNKYTVSKYILSQVHSEDIENLQNHISLLKNNKLDKCDCIFRIKTNNADSWKWILGRATRDYSKDNKINTIVGSISDITERKETENITRIIFLISSAVNITREPKELFRAIHTILKRYVGYSNLLVSLWDSDENTIEYPYLEDDQNTVEEILLLQNNKTIPPYINNVLQSGKQIIFTEETTNTPKIWLSTPLRVRNSIVGTITTYRFPTKIEGTYSKRDKELMIAIGEQVAIAIERYQNEKQLTTMALHDPLTGLPNRVLMNDRVEHAIRRVQRNGDYRFAVFMLDLDRFKLINDTHGHNTGDLLLIEVSKRMLALLRAQDTVARLGGDEFAIILENLHSTHEALAVAKRILKAIEQPIFIDGKELRTATTIGIVLDASTYDSAQALMRDADIAMYDAKSNGKGRFRVFDQAMHQQMLDYVSLENDLANAVTNKQLYLDFQPILSTKENKLLGFEALVRWNHPEKGIVPPSKFIPIAEENGHIIGIGNWVLEEACRIMHSWVSKKTQVSHLTISVNLSAKQAVQTTLTNTIGDILKKTGLSPEQLKLEITETTIMSDPKNALKSFNTLRSMGIHIAIDDFGTGYSSMAYLQKFPVDTIKIDRTFIMNLASSSDDGSLEIVRAISSLAHGLGMNIVAEGVETQEQLNAIIECGCEAVQGFLFSLPLQEEDAFKYIENHLSS